jgi:heptosyltransferase-2
MIYIFLTYLFSPILYLLLYLKRRENISNILVIQEAKIGDMICSTPVFREIKKKYGQAHLTVMVNPATRELLEYNPHVDEIMPIRVSDYKGLTGKIKLANLIRKGKYDVAICLNSNVLFAIATFWGLVPIRISVWPNFAGITFSLASKLYSHLEKHVSGTLVIETYLRMLQAIGIESADITKEVFKSRDADKKVENLLKKVDKPILGFALGTRNPLKQLDNLKVLQLLQRLLDNREVYIALVGAKQEATMADFILNNIPEEKRIINTVGKLNLQELPALMEKLALLIGVDTGTIYMADALGIPVIDIAGPANMEDQRPIGGKAVIIQNASACAPCSHVFRTPYTCQTGTKECVESVSIGEVYAAAKKLLSAKI